MSQVTFDHDGLRERLTARAARSLLKVALTFQGEARADVSVGNPAPHDHPAPRGEFPRLRTGQGRANLVPETTDLDRIAREGRVRVGYRMAGMHLGYLRRKGWKGLADTLARVRPALAALLGRPA